MSQRTYEQKQLITQMFAKKTQQKPTASRADPVAVERRRRIEAIEEQKRLELAFSL